MADERKINSASGDILTKIISFALKKCRPKNVVHGLWSEASAEAPQVQARLTPRTTNRPRPCKMTVSGLVIQITIAVPNLLC
jgi:hypothetical protein